MRRTLLLAALLLAACSSTPGPAMRSGPGEGWTPLPTENAASFRTEDRAIVEKIDIGDFHAYADGKGGLKVTCQIRNVTDAPLLVQVRALFQKEDGTPSFESPWRSVMLAVGKFIPFEATDEGTRAVVEMRLPPKN